jgi:methyltransferase (TIGR00027 family)
LSLEPSSTALGVAMLRAAHQVVDDEPRVLVDPIALRLLGSDAAERMRARTFELRTPGACALRAHVLLRSRFAEDRLQASVARGVRQYVLLGAGFDTFAYRQPEWAHSLRIFEVDQPATQGAKRERLGAAAIEPPSNVTFVPIDFEHQTLSEGLSVNGFDAGALTFVSCLGVLVYLTHDAIVDLFRFVASLPSGSECAFTFGGVTPGAEGPGRLAEMAARVGEPWRSSLEIDDVRTVLSGVGLQALTTLSSADAMAYLGERRDGLTAPRRERIASVVV